MKANAVGLGDLLVQSGKITAKQLEDALAEQKETRERLGQILYRWGLITQEDLVDTLARQLGLRRFDPGQDAVEPASLAYVPIDFARRFNVLPVRITDKSLCVAVVDPLDVEAMDPLKRIARRSDRKLELLLASPAILERARESSYRLVEGSKNVTELIDKVVGEIGETIVEDEPDEEEAERRAQEAGIVNLVEQVIAQAIQERATDIHIEPTEAGLVIRYRVDGMLYDALTPPRAVYTGTISRIKILSNMDIAERRAAQDGRFTHRKNGVEVDVRVSAIPTIHGEKLVLRLLDKTDFYFSLRDLGFSKTDYDRFIRAINQPYGMVVLSGPTGSGKTTTLYAGLLERRNETLNITTI